jgi:hypothetical protein
MSICALTFPKGFVRASVMASIGMAPVRTMLGTDGARPTVVQTASPRLLLEDYGVKSDGFVLLGSGVWCCPLSFPDGILVHLPRLGWQT